MALPQRGSICPWQEGAGEAEEALIGPHLCLGPLTWEESEPQRSADSANLNVGPGAVPKGIYM